MRAHAELLKRDYHPAALNNAIRCSHCRRRACRVSLPAPLSLRAITLRCIHRLMAAAWMARTGIRTLVVERKSRPTDAGHADGLESRTIEILDSFGLGQKIWDESNHTIDICLWVRGISARCSTFIGG